MQCIVRNAKVSRGTYTRRAPLPVIGHWARSWVYTIHYTLSLWRMASATLAL